MNQTCHFLLKLNSVIPPEEKTKPRHQAIKNKIDDENKNEQQKLNQKFIFV